MKKLVSVVLTIILLCGVTAVASYAETCNHNFGEWTVLVQSYNEFQKHIIGTKTRTCSLCSETEQRSFRIMNPGQKAGTYLNYLEELRVDHWETTNASVALPVWSANPKIPFDQNNVEIYAQGLGKAIVSAIRADNTKIAEMEIIVINGDLTNPNITEDTEFFTLWGKATKWEKTPLNWFLLIVCFGWIWMAF